MACIVFRVGGIKFIGISVVLRPQNKVHCMDGAMGIGEEKADREGKGKTEAVMLSGADIIIGEGREQRRLLLWK